MASSKNLPAINLPQKYKKVAIAHDWLTGMRGGEAILEVLCELFPDADLHTLFFTDRTMSPIILNGRKIYTSVLQPLANSGPLRQRYQNLLPLFPAAVKTLHFDRYDLILSHSHCVIKGLQKPAHAKHISYISSPMRYMWDRFDDYFNADSMPWYKTAVARMIRRPLQRWDVQSTRQVDHLIANSEFVRERIQQCWQRDAEVIHPFVNLERFPLRSTGDGAGADFYLIVAAFVPYKRLDLAVQACSQLGRKLKIVGKGQEESRLKRLADPEWVDFLGPVGNDELVSLYQQARAFLFPGMEDFGITPLEAMAAGCPVIAYKAGGALETINSETGYFFTQQTVDGMTEAVLAFEKENYSPETCHARARQFSRQNFRDKLIAAIEKQLTV